MPENILLKVRYSLCTLKQRIICTRELIAVENSNPIGHCIILLSWPN